MIKRLHSKATDPLSPLVLQWVTEISRAFQARKGNAIQMGKLVHQAKAELKYGGWRQLWRDHQMPFTKRTGDKLALIGEELGELDAKTSSHLPCSLETLYFLAVLGRQLTTELILDGSIDETITFSRARDLRDKFKPETKWRRTRWKVDRELSRMREFFLFLQAEGQSQEQEAVRASVKEMVTTLLKAKANPDLQDAA